MFAAMRRASSLVSGLAADRRPYASFWPLPSFTTKQAPIILNGPRRREAACRHRAFDAVSGASCFVERSAKLFDKGARRLQIGKAPTIITLLVSPNGASKSGRDPTRFVKGNNLTVQFDIQSIRGDRHLDNKGVFPLVGGRLTGSIR